MLIKESKLHVLHIEKQITKRLQNADDILTTDTSLKRVMEKDYSDLSEFGFAVEKRDDENLQSLLLSLGTLTLGDATPRNSNPSTENPLETKGSNVNVEQTPTTSNLTSEISPTYTESGLDQVYGSQPKLPSSVGSQQEHESKALFMTPSYDVSSSASSHPFEPFDPFSEPASTTATPTASTLNSTVTSPNPYDDNLSTNSILTNHTDTNHAGDNEHNKGKNETESTPSGPDFLSDVTMTTDNVNNGETPSTHLQNHSSSSRTTDDSENSRPKQPDRNERSQKENPDRDRSRRSSTGRTKRELAD